MLAFIPVGLAWVLGWALLFLVKRVRSRPQAGNEHYPQIANAEDNKQQHGKKDYFPAPWSVEKIAGGFKVIDVMGNRLRMSTQARIPMTPLCVRCSPSMKLDA